MAFQHKDGFGALFKNSKATGKQPPYRGSCCIDGRQIDISAWVKETKKGAKYFSLSFREHDTDKEG